jgi:cell division protein FtsL
MDAVRPRRARLRRGGSRTPFPLLPLIGIIAGVAIAYVSQTAHVTQRSYQVAALTAEQAQLSADNQRLGDQLDRLTSAERVDAAAQQLGMRPAAQWSYVAAPAPVVAAPPAPQPARDSQNTDALTRIVAVLSGSFGTRNAEAAGP